MEASYFFIMKLKIYTPESMAIIIYEINIVLYSFYSNLRLKKLLTTSYSKNTAPFTSDGSFVLLI